jgi:hypothetical protein
LMRQVRAIHGAPCSSVNVLWRYFVSMSGTIRQV